MKQLLSYLSGACSFRRL